MKTLAYLLLGALIWGCDSSRVDNYRKALESLEIKHQAELDKGERMMIVEQEYKVSMDSMLNVVYKELVLKLNDTQKENLRIEQLEWMRQRDIEFEELRKPLTEMTNDFGFVPQDARMVVYSQQANYIRKRVLELVDKLEEK